MKAFVVRLPDELAEFVEEAVGNGDWDNVNQVFVQAVLSFRTAGILGGALNDTPAAGTPKTEVELALAQDIPAQSQDSSRVSFDTPTFMAGLMRKLCDNAPL